MVKKKNTISETEMKLLSVGTKVNNLETKININLEEIKKGFKKKTGIGTAAVQTTLAALAIGFITLGLKVVDTDLQTGGILAGIGAGLLLIDFYISGK